MKKITLALAVLFISMTSFLNSQTNSSAGYYGGVHDSLLFDGSGETIIQPVNSSSDCYVRVNYIKGTPIGTYYVKKTYNICEKIENVTEKESGKLSLMNELVLGEEITTDENSSLELQFYDGSIMRVGPNSKVTITGNMCESQTLIDMTGRVWSKVKKLLGNQKYNLKTKSYFAGVRGTEFSVETTDEGVITKVFEGSVEIKSTESTGSDNTKDAAKDYEKLVQDYQSGKITIEEFAKKSQEYQKTISKSGEDVKGKMCEAGFMITSPGSVGDPVPIVPGSNWFDDENFK